MHNARIPFACMAALLSALGFSGSTLGQSSLSTGGLPAAVPPTVQDASSQSRQKDQASSFLRLHRELGAPISLDTAVVTYRSSQPEGASVDLVGAVHIGEASYYEQLNELFDNYDVVLYELVAPAGTVIPAGGKREHGGFNPVAMLQDSAKNLLGLESQLEQIDYTKPHFVRADMTPTQLSEKMAERGETPLTLALSTLADALRQQNVATRQTPEAITELSLFDMLSNPPKLKRALAEQFASTGSLDEALGGPLKQLLIVDRNGQATQELQKQLAAGKKRIAIFYGAAHLPDFERRLINEFGLQRSAEQWIPAWDLSAEQPAAAQEPATLMWQLLKGLEN